MSKYRSKYGFQWPAQVSDVQIELELWKKWREEPYSGNVTDPWEHGLRAARALFSHSELIISPWTEEHFHDWTMEKFCITWGCASSGKSNDYGMMALLDWIIDPLETATIFASTTKSMLMLRSWESVTRYFRILKKNPYFEVPGKEAAVSTAIVNDDNTDATTKASLRGVAVKDGSSEKARANLAGVHTKYTRLIADELSQMPQAILDARHNLRIGSLDSRFFGLANPDSYHDLGASVSVPDDPLGWASVNENHTSWRSTYGLVRHHNGLLSPAITEPGGKEKYPHLINQDTVDAILQENHGNLDSPVLWSQVKGFPPPGGTVNTVLTDRDLIAFHAQVPVVWVDSIVSAAGRGASQPEHQPAPNVRRLVPPGFRPASRPDDGALVMVAGLDPSFSSGGDNCVFQPAMVGLSRDGIYTISFLAPEYIPIKSSDDRPVAYQISDAAIMICDRFRIPIQNLAIDDSGTQSVADIVQVESRVTPIRCSFGSRASDNPISAINPEPAKNRVSDQATEIWTMFAELVRADQVRGLCLKAAEQFTSRAYVSGKRPLKLETKKDYKRRTGGSSPDEADAVALAALAARRVAGLFPGRGREQVPWVGAGDPLRPPSFSTGPLTPSYTTSSLSGYTTFGLDFGARR